MQRENSKFELSPPAGHYNSEDYTEHYMEALEYVRADVEKTYAGYIAICFIALCYFPVFFGFLFLIRVMCY